jgi:hypothetical protein
VRLSGAFDVVEAAVRGWRAGAQCTTWCAAAQRVMWCSAGGGLQATTRSLGERGWRLAACQAQAPASRRTRRGRRRRRARAAQARALGRARVRPWEGKWRGGAGTEAMARVLPPPLSWPCGVRRRWPPCGLAGRECQTLPPVCCCGWHGVCVCVGVCPALQSPRAARACRWPRSCWRRWAGARARDWAATARCARHGGGG